MQMINKRRQLISIKAFTLIELLVVMSIIALLVSIIMPSLARGRMQARSVVCQSNLRQLFLANLGYATENDDSFVPAASDIWTGSGGRRRWHGVRESDGVDPDPTKNYFDPLQGPLNSYLAGGEVKECSELVNFVKDGALNAYEAGCGGYGYNRSGVGSRVYHFGPGEKAVARGMKTSNIKHAVETVMFTDAAMVQGDPEQYLTEYSFCESPFWVEFDSNGKLLERYFRIPSIHFRHLGRTNVSWVDGHCSSEEYSFNKTDVDNPVEFKTGWFGPKNNSLFDPY